jgi:hypothetical protein
LKQTKKLGLIKANAKIQVNGAREATMARINKMKKDAARRR